MLVRAKWMIDPLENIENKVTNNLSLLAELLAELLA